MAKSKPSFTFDDFLNTVWGEGASARDPQEIAALGSVYLNRDNLNASNAYRKKNKQFMKAQEGNLSTYERKIYNRMKLVLEPLYNGETPVLPYDYHENVRAFGDPSWAPDMANFDDIGQQRFYVSKSKYQDALKEAAAK